MPQYKWRENLKMNINWNFMNILNKRDTRNVHWNVYSCGVYFGIIIST